MPISPFTFPPNPTFGNPFNTEAVVQNTLNTAMKANLTLLQTYYNTTGWEEQYLASQSVTSRQLYPQGNYTTWGTGWAAVPTTDTLMGNVVTITIPATISTAKVLFWCQLVFRNDTTGTQGLNGVLRNTTTASDVGVRFYSPSANNNLFFGTFPIVATETLAPGTYNYQILAKSDLGVSAANRGFFRESSTIQYIVINNFS